MPEIKVMSFAYDKGLPKYSSNDKLYVFDCRTIKDPMWETFLNYSGNDAELQAQFEKQVPMKDFLEKTQDFLFLVQDQALANSDSRDSIIAFGCTNGRHRSVYCADKIAKNLFDKYKIPVLCTHREQNTEYYLKI